MSLDLTPLQKALASLEEAIHRFKDAPTDKGLRDSVILRFEYSWELCIKMLIRQLDGEIMGMAKADLLPYRELLREGIERGLLADVDSWVEYRNQRNEAAHTYNEKKALVVYKTALDFYPNAMDLLNKLEQRNP